jgi:pyruvate dehydrogenase complex dehydrogenase (E1) component
MMNILNKLAIRYEKNFESFGNLIKSYAPHQIIESKNKEQIESIMLMDKTMKGKFNTLKSWGITEVNKNILQKINELTSIQKQVKDDQ